MTDERLAELKADRDKAVDEHAAMKANMDAMQKELRENAQRSQKLQAAHSALREPRNVLAERVTALSDEIRAEEKRRDEAAAEAKRKADKEAAEAKA